MLCAVKVDKLFGEFSTNMSHKTDSLPRCRRAVHRCGFPACFGVCGKSFSPWSLDSHRGSFSPELQSASRVLASKDLSDILLNFIPPFLLCICVLASLWHTARERVGRWCGPGHSRTPLLPFSANKDYVAGSTCGESGRGRGLYRTLSL